MTKEELLQPRFKVIADYPYNPFVLNEIVFTDQKGEVVGMKTGYVDYDLQITEQNLSKYPLLFKPLEWWEERDLKDMPEYIRIAKPDLSFKEELIIKPKKWDVFPDEGNGWGNEGQPFALIVVDEELEFYSAGEEIRMHASNVMPATKEEYEAQNSLPSQS